MLYPGGGIKIPNNKLRFPSGKYSVLGIISQLKNIAPMVNPHTTTKLVLVLESIRLTRFEMPREIDSAF